MTFYSGSVLIVDDEVDAASALGEALSRKSLSVECAAGADDAIEKLSAASYAMIILDHHLPDHGSDAVLRYLTSRSDARVPVVLVMSDVPELIVGKIDCAAVHGVVRKSIDPSELAALIESCIDIQSSRELDTMLALLLAGMPFLRYLGVV